MATPVTIVQKLNNANEASWLQLGTFHVLYIHTATHCNQLCSGEAEYILIIFQVRCGNPFRT
jgi:hypothetical protein